MKAYLKAVIALIVVSFVLTIVILATSISIGYLGNFVFDWGYSIHLRYWLFNWYLTFLACCVIAFLPEKNREITKKFWS